MQAVNNSKAIVRKAAPSFKATAWWQGKFQELSLEQFKGKFKNIG